MSVVVVVLLVAIGYTYLGYPVICFVASRAISFKATSNAAYRPRVTVVVTAFNEEKAIVEKINNILSSDYPSELLDVLIASDGSTDATDCLVEGLLERNVSLLRVTGRQGKTATQNVAIAAAIGEIIVFTDATTQLDGQAISNMVSRLADSQLGCVAGILIYKSMQQTATGSGGQKYWRYEMLLRALEARSAGLVGVSGCLYAMRKKDYRLLPPDIISDFAIPLELMGRGLRTDLAVDAICWEDTLERGKAEFHMRQRVIIRSLAALVFYRHLLNPFRYGFFAIQLFSHKVLRYVVAPLALALYAFAWLSSDHLLSRLIVMCGSAVFIMALLGLILPHNMKWGRRLSIPYYFVLSNLASLVGLVKFVFGKRIVVWTPERS